MEFSTKEAFEKMKTTSFEFHKNLIINKEYSDLRNKIFNILHKISIDFGLKNQTYFLSTYFLDIIFSQKKKLNENIYKIGLSCLYLAAKFYDNEQMVPNLRYFIKAYNIIIDFKYIFSIDKIKKGEILVCKLLNYKLNYYTIYDYNRIFFSNGILEIEQIENKQIYKKKDSSFNSQIVQNILKKIYKKSTYFLNNIIKIYEICIKYNKLFISILIMKKSIEIILKNELNIKNKEEFYKKNDLFF